MKGQPIHLNALHRAKAFLLTRTNYYLENKFLQIYNSYFVVVWLSFGGGWDNAPSPTSSSSIISITTVSSSPSKKIPPPPPIRKYHPYSFERNDNNETSNQAKKKLQFGGGNDAPLASSPSYLAHQLRKVHHIAKLT